MQIGAQAQHHAVATLDPETAQNVRKAVGQFSQRRIRIRLAIEPGGDFCAAASSDVPIDDRHRNIELRGD